MKRFAIAASVGTILIGTHSFVYACGDKAQTAKAHAPKAAKVATFYVADATTVVKTAQVIEERVVCKTVEAAAPIAIEVEVPAEAFNMARVIHIRGAAVQHPETETTAVDSVKRTVKVAQTLGRAFVTTIGAVFGSLVDAAVQATSSLV
jgi:hypothetical protein